MFIKYSRPMAVYCELCTTCKWCHERDMRKNMFRVRDGPIDHYFCDGDCHQKWVTYRHMIGAAHVVRASPKIRAAYLKGMTIDEFISNGMSIDAEVQDTGNVAARGCDSARGEVPL